MAQQSRVEAARAPNGVQTQITSRKWRVQSNARTPMEDVKDSGLPVKNKENGQSAHEAVETPIKRCGSSPKLPEGTSLHVPHYYASTRRCGIGGQLQSLQNQSEAFRPGTSSTPLQKLPINAASTPSALFGECAEPVDAFIDKLSEGRETVIEPTWGGSLDPSLAILRAQGQQRLPSLEIYKLSGNPIEWPQFIERFRDQVHSKSSLTDSDRMAYLYQHLDGEARKAVESLGISGHSYPAALKTLKKLFGNHHRVTAAHLKKMADSPYVQPGDRNGLRDHYYRVKACVTWCSKLGQSAVLQNPEYISKVAMKLPSSLRVRWYEHIQDRYDTVALQDFVQWIQKRVESLFNPFEDYIREDSKSARIKQVKSKPITYKVGAAINPFNTSLVPPQTARDNKSKTEESGRREKCLLCPANHRLVYCDEFKEKSVKDRKRIAFDQHLCFNCLKSDHGVKDCPSDKRCMKDGCGKKHHTLLHEEQRAETKQQSTKVKTVPPVYCPIKEDNFHEVSTLPVKRVALQILPVKVQAPNGLSRVYALLDPGSDTTLIRKDLADQLQLDGDAHQVKLNTVGSETTSHYLKLVSFDITSDAHPEPVRIDKAWVVNKMNIPTFSCDQATKRWEHLRGIDLPDLKGEEVKLLIGSNMAHLLVHLEIRQGAQNEPVAVRTPLGWTLFGNISDNNNKDEIHPNAISLDTHLHDVVERFWEIDSYGTKRSEGTGSSVQDRRALKILDETTERIDGHYVTGLLWKDDELSLPNNLRMAESRLRATERKLAKKPELAQKYRGVIHEYTAKGHCRKLTTEESTSTSERTWYLPHHAVLNPNKPGKLRVVFDAAAKFNNVSLNDCLLTGPDLLNNLIGVLMRFRLGKTAVMGDIEKMFHQVGVFAKDQDSLRFLWRDLDVKRPPDEYRMQVHVFGAVDSPCCASYALRRTAEDNKMNYSESILRTILHNFYMDDVLASTPTAEQASILVKKLIEVVATGGFRLNKWVSNSREVLNQLPQSELAVVDLDRNDLPQERALGIKWALEQDTLFLKPVTEEFPNSKRGILGATCSVFDPLGFAAPYVIKAKLIMQELWRRHIEWDDPLPVDILRSWCEWKNGLSRSLAIRVPRWYGFHRHEAQSVQLHVFCDASEIAYGAVAYLRAVVNEEVIVSFLLGKTRLAPIKAVTVPRLELQGAVVAVRLKSKILEEIDLEIDDVHLWTDSKTVLQYIINEFRRFSAYVSHRVAEILSVTKREEWHHIPGKMNVADDCTRGIASHELTDKCRWLSGPPFLKLPECDWPNQDVPVVDESELEIKPSVLAVSTVSSGPLINWERFSRLGKFLRVFGWCMRYKYKLTCKVRRTEPVEDRRSEFLSVRDLEEATEALCRQAQTETFPQEYSNLLNGKPVSSSSPLLSLQPMMKDRLLKVGGRLNKAPIAGEAKHQIILSSKHPLSRLIVKDMHERNRHVGREHTLALVRQRYWIIHGKGLVRTVIKECFFCMKRRTNPQVPVMAPLPKARFAAYQTPFTNTGVDYFGPMNVKRGRVTEKRWGCFFTCLTTRAVHLELAGDLSADAFILALRRFRARRGDPKIMLSDNGTNFVEANRELAEALEELEAERRC